MTNISKELILHYKFYIAYRNMFLSIESNQPVNWFGYLYGYEENDFK